MKTMLGGFDGVASRRTASVDAREARKERRWIIRESFTRGRGTARPSERTVIRQYRKLFDGVSWSKFRHWVGRSNNTPHLSNDQNNRPSAGGYGLVGPKP